MLANHTMLLRLALRISDQIYIFWKRLLSLNKDEWSLTDYPIRIKKQITEPPYQGSSFKTPPFRAHILNWNISGTGETKEEALRSLEQHFTERKLMLRSEDKPVPQPGKQVPIEFASQEKTNTHQALADDFIRRVLHLEWSWISDESSLWDFHTEETNARFVILIREVYGVDISDIEDVKLWRIFERIESARRNQ
jgi:hypothetical protein